MTQKLWMVLGAVAAFGVFLAIFFLVAQHGGEGTPEPSPSSTAIPGGPINVPTPTLPSPSATAGNPDDAAGPSDDHDHSHDGACEDGPACDQGEQMVDIPQADVDASNAVASVVKTFTTQWLTIDSSESAANRAGRLRDTGASSAVSTQAPRIARADSGQQGLTVHATPQRTMMTLFLGRENGLLKFRTGVNVDTDYKIITGSKSFHVVGGSVTVHITDAGVIQKVVEDFPTIDSMH